MILKLLVRCLSAFLVLSSIQTLAEERQDEVFVYASELQAANPHACIAVGFIQGEAERVEHFGCEASDYFQIGSITKVFTTMALAASTQVDLDTQLSDIIQDGLSPAAQQITLGQLATHTSGLPRLPDNIDLTSLEDPYASYGPDALMNYLAGYRPPNDKAPSFTYSNLGVGLLGHTLAMAEERTFSEVLQIKVLSPLGLTNTWIDPANASSPGNVLQGHDAEGQPNTNWSFDALAGAGALWSNLPDMMHFAREQLGLVKSPLSSAMAATHRSRATAGDDMEVGLGWLIDTRAPSFTWHNGGTAGFRSWIGFSGDRSQAAVVLASGLLPEVDLMGQALMGASVPLPKLTQGRELSHAQAELYLGRYQLRPQALLDVTLDQGELYVQVSGQPRFKLIYIDEDYFRTQQVPAEFDFTRKKSRITHVTIHQGGQEIKARRIGDVPNRLKLRLSAPKLERLVGTYRIQRNFELEVTRQRETLWVQATGQPKFPIFAESETRFFLEVVAADLEFKVEDDEVKGVWLHQNGKQYGKKVE